MAKEIKNTYSHDLPEEKSLVLANKRNSVSLDELSTYQKKLNKYASNYEIELENTKRLVKMDSPMPPAMQSSVIMRRSNYAIRSKPVVDNNRSSDESTESKDYFEIFDPSLIFVDIFRCYYWDSKDRIRKGKIFLTKTELFFKCSRMPFVKLRLHFKDVKEISKIKNYKHRLESVIFIEAMNGKSYAFYKFRLPKNIIKTRLQQLIDECKKDYDQEDTQSVNSNLLRLRKVSQID